MANVIGVPDHSRSLFHLLGRTVSVVVASILFVVFLPLGLMIALLIRLESPGSPLLCQERVGLNEARFGMYKFRTMRQGCDVGMEKHRNDIRVTRLGHFLRWSSLDELPQLMNVILGDMGFVGPRPELPQMLSRYAVHQRARFSVLPGLTGLWQVSGRSDLELEEKLRLDLLYLQKRSALTDLGILLRTPMAVFTGRGAF